MKSQVKGVLVVGYIGDVSHAGPSAVEIVLGLGDVPAR